ncbi:MAG TPA: TlpA disulfide reductase family protein [Terriglobia bacterium]|nr:TlpA disulfide reductase family protein [Terriglobia bacterium]
MNSAKAARFVSLILLLAAPAALLAKSSLPKLKVRDLSGAAASLNPYRGKIIVLNFWATWCEPCQQEMPMLVKEEANYRDRGVVVIGVSLDKPGDEDKIRAFISKYHIAFPVWTGGTADDLDRWKLGPAVPATAFIDPDGKIEGRIKGEIRKPLLEHRLDWMLGRHEGEAPAPVENNLK